MRGAGGPGSGNFGHAGRPGEVGGSAPSSGGGDAGGTPDSEGVGTRRWNGMDVDREFVDEQGKSPVLDRLNAVLGINIISTNAGHPPGGVGVGAGAVEELSVGFQVNGSGSGAEETAELFADRLRETGAQVETRYWRGEFGNWVTHINGQPRLDTFSESQINAFPTDRASVRVTSPFKWKDSTRDQRDTWWSTVADKLEEVAR